METVTTTYDDLYQDDIERLCDAGFDPCDVELFAGVAAKTVDYFGRRGWDAARHNGDSITFVTVNVQEGNRIMVTSLSGVIQTEATFSTDRFGERMFFDACAMRP